MAIIHYSKRLSIERIFTSFFCIITFIALSGCATALQEAVRANDIQKVRTLLNKGENINEHGEIGNTPLNESALRGHTDIARLIIDKNASIEEKNNFERTALIIAAIQGHTDIVKFLLDKGANINAKDKWGSTSLHLSAVNDCADVVRILLDRGANIGGKNSFGFTPKQWAREKGQTNIVSMLEAEEIRRRQKPYMAKLKKLSKDDRYFRVISSIAVVREMPDAEAMEVSMLSKEELVHVTGSLPSGWFQVSREGKSIGWVHSTLLREDFASALTYKPVEAPKFSLPTVPPSAVPTDVTASSFDFGSYHALVVGNNDYQHLPKLQTAVNDAQAIVRLLQNSYGFNVRLLRNGTRADILRAMNGYRRTLTNRDNLLIFYAGHGWLDKDADQGYWLPVDAEKQDSTNWISNGSITDALRALEAKHVLVIADSCYSGKLARGVNVRIRAKNYYEKISKKKARTVMSSGGLEPVADDGGKGSHSVFASALIEALNENSGVLDATLLFSKIRRPVMVNTDQNPEYSDIRKAGHDGGDFIFVRNK